LRFQKEQEGKPMNCTPELLEAWMDEELGAAEAAALEQHIAGCAECADAAARLRGQKAGIREVAPYYQAPAALRGSVRAALRRSAGEERRGWGWVAIAASILLALSIGGNVVQLRPHGASNVLAESVLDDHLRSLLATHLVDVPSSDQHTVKPWFAGKLDFSPVVKDLAAEGIPLQGGRLEYIAGRPVAALVYRRRQHVINLFTWPAGAAAEPETRVTRNGYHLLHWTEGGMTYWAVSDASAEELDRFRSIFER
jgi:anti-sigma factor RsiW